VVTNNANDITLSLPQPIDQSATPIFATIQTGTGTGQGQVELYQMQQALTPTSSVQFDDVLFTPKTTVTDTTGRVYYNSTDNNLYVYDGSSWVDLTQQDTDTNLSETDVEDFVYDSDNNLRGNWAVNFGSYGGAFN